MSRKSDIASRVMQKARITQERPFTWLGISTLVAANGGNHGTFSDRNHKRPASIGTGIMFTRRHYDYLADTIINDPELPGELRQSMYEALGSWFKRDFPNFQWIKWDKVWIDHFR